MFLFIFLLIINLPDFLDYRMENRTYRYFRGKALYPFGYGLSYTTFSIGKGQLSASTMNKDGKVTLTVPVTNTGKREGTETVQVYVKALDYPDAPIKSLKGFRKLSLKAGETATATITLENRPTRAQTVLTPPCSARMPKVSRGVPTTGSVPTRLISRPRQPAVSPFSKRLAVSEPDVFDS